MSLIGKARSRPDQVRKLVDSVAQQGVRSTYAKAMNQLDSYTPLGYSLCGVVVEVGRGAEEFKVGQLVACAGNEFALHAEVNWVPRNLCVPVPDGVEPQLAAFATVGAIAMQGVRRAEPQLGDTACVVGLGLVGQLVVQLLVAAGRPGRRPRRRRRPLPAGREGRGRRLRRARRRRARPDRAGPGRADRGHRRRPRLPGGRRVVQRPGRGGRPAGPRPGPGGRHRQAEAGPAVERLLRQGARRPLLPVLRPGPLRRQLRARGRRLPGRLRPLDRAPQPRSASSTCSPGRPCRSTCWSPASFPVTEAADVYGRLRAGELHGVGFLFEYPEATATPTRAVGRRGLGIAAPGPTTPRPAARPGHRGAARRLHRRRQLRLVDAPAAPGPGARTSSWPTWRPTRRCRPPTPSAGSASPRRRPTSTGCSTTTRIDAVFVVTRHHTHAELVCRALEAGKATFVEKPLALDDEQLGPHPRRRRARPATTGSWSASTGGSPRC